MNPAESIESINDGGKILDLLNEYIIACANTKPITENAKDSKNNSPTLFPNLAGFCRFLKISTLELEELGKKFPDCYSRLLTVFEDEALNSKLSPTIVSAYMKKRLGYDHSTPLQNNSQLEIKFEHDIFKDGE